VIAGLFAGWGVVSLLAGLVIGRVIRRADEIEGRTHAVQDATDRPAPLYVPQEWVA